MTCPACPLPAPDAPRTCPACLSPVRRRRAAQDGPRSRYEPEARGLVYRHAGEGTPRRTPPRHSWSLCADVALMAAGLVLDHGRPLRLVEPGDGAQPGLRLLAWYRYTPLTREELERIETVNQARRRAADRSTP